jgi:hypothetical protein
MCSVAATLGGPASENGRLRHRDEAHGPDGRCRRALMLAILQITSSGRGPRTGRALPEGIDVGYPPGGVGNTGCEATPCASVTLLLRVIGRLTTPTDSGRIACP